MRLDETELMRLSEDERRQYLALSMDAQVARAVELRDTTLQAPAGATSYFKIVGSWGFGISLAAAVIFFIVAMEAAVYGSPNFIWPILFSAAASIFFTIWMVGVIEHRLIQLIEVTRAKTA